MKVVLAAVNAKYIHSNLAVYSLKKYAEKYGNNEHEIIIKEYTINQYVDEMIADIYKEHADVLGFSCYIWNIEYIIQLINDLKTISSDLQIIVGGPEVSYNPEEVLARHSNIDYVMYGEGEEIWKQFLDNYVEGRLQKQEINGLAYKSPEGIKINPVMQPVDLSKIPFVYDSMDNFKHKIVYYETSRGCPFSCSYCLSSIDKNIRFRDLDLVRKELQFFINNRVEQVKFIDRTFNCNPNHALEIWKYIKEHDNGITNFHFEIAADLMTKEELELISDMRPGLIQLEIGVQSVNQKTLEAIHRKTDIDKIEKVTRTIGKNHNIHQHLDLIAGLPYEDYASFGNSFNRVYAMRPDQLQLGFLKVLHGADISGEAKEYEMVYSSRAPYEVLKTKWITFDEILKLKEVEAVLEIYYNSLQFSVTISKLEKYFDSPFQMYEKLGQFYHRNSLNGAKHARVSRYVLLRDFIEQEFDLTQEERAQWEEALTIDFYLRENAKSRPVFSKDLTPYREKIKKIYRNPQLISKLQGYAGCSSKQIEHMTHIEILEDKYILFDYQNRDVLSKSAAMIDVTDCLQY